MMLDKSFIGINSSFCFVDNALVCETFFCTKSKLGDNECANQNLPLHQTWYNPLR
jgi:hypothetical protein